MYKITTKTVKDEFNNPITVYGIKSDNEEYSELTTDVTEIEKLCQLCNEMKLDIVHFKDVVEDFIVLKSCDTHEEKSR